MKYLRRLPKFEHLAPNTVMEACSLLAEHEGAKLIAGGILDISGLVDPEAVPGHRLVMVGVKLNTMDLVKKGEEFSRLKGVVSVSVVTGRFDLILQVFLKEGFGLLEFYTEEVSKIDDVQSVETFVVYKSYNLKIPYIF